jgi:hypothetical protein
VEQGIDRGLSGKHHVEADTAQGKAEVHALVREIEDRTRHVDVDVDVDPDRLGRAATQISSSLIEAANTGRSCDEHDGVQRALQQPSKTLPRPSSSTPSPPGWSNWAVSPRQPPEHSACCRVSLPRSTAVGCWPRSVRCTASPAMTVPRYRPPPERDEQGLTALAR